MSPQERASEVRIERWPNGAIKSQEPFVNGLREGLATYTFDNGAIYGRIPWRNGQKDGNFRLYRRDGTPEQDLSYKNGQLHGTCRWFNSDGTLQQEATYFEGKVVSAGGPGPISAAHAAVPPAAPHTAFVDGPWWAVSLLASAVAWGILLYLNRPRGRFD